MSEAAFTFQIFGRSCVVILPPSLEVPPANDVLGPAIGVAQRAQGAQSRSGAEPPVLGAPEALATGHAAPAIPAPRPSEIVLRGGQRDPEVRREPARRD
jgi:hypothetical protein